MAAVVSLDVLIDFVHENAASAEVLDQLATAAATAASLGELGDSLLGHFVDQSRRQGHTWAEIGTSLGVSKQAVQKRFVERAAVPSLERFTDRARRVLVHAAASARHLGHNYRGTEHILLGLFDEPDGVAAHVLSELDVTRAGIEVDVRAVTPGLTTTIPAGDLPLTPRGVRVLELAVSSAVELGHNYIGTEHILLGIMRERDGLAARVLTARGLDQETVTTQVIAALTGYSATT
jgi:hypothetical protein